MAVMLKVKEMVGTCRGAFGCACCMHEQTQRKLRRRIRRVGNERFRAEVREYLGR